MAVTVSLYNHTAKNFADGTFNPADTFKLMLLTSGTYDATDALLADVVYTQVASGNGYTTGGQALTNLTLTTVTTNDAKLDADDVIWTASGGSIAASAALLYDDTETGDPVVLYIDFGGTQTASDGADFRIVWNSTNGIITWTVA